VTSGTLGDQISVASECAGESSVRQTRGCIRSKPIWERGIKAFLHVNQIGGGFGRVDMRGGVRGLSDMTRIRRKDRSGGEISTATRAVAEGQI